jgi:hypothetical protein
MGSKRRRFKQTDTLEARLARFAHDLREQADQAPLAEDRNALLKRAYNADQAIDLERQLRESATAAATTCTKTRISTRPISKPGMSRSGS